MEICLNMFLLFLLFISSTVSRASLSHLTLKQAAQTVGEEELWCVAKNNAEDATLQSALDWACGSGGSNCGPIQQGGPCYDLADIQRMASYAFNDYFLKHGLTEDSCDFNNAAALTSLNPSYGNCKFPSSSTGKNGNFSGSSTVGTGQAVADMSGSSYISCTRFLVLTSFVLLLFGLSF